MANTCRECGGDVFIGELRCPKCNAAIPNAREVAFTEGVTIPESGGGLPPAEGLGLIIDKMQTDMEITRRNEREAMGNYGGTGPGLGMGADDGTFSSALGQAITGRSFEDSFDGVADMVRPERDAHGNIKYDLKYALVGAVVVAAIAAYAFWRVFLVVDAVSKFSRVS